jgi:hypothetical protein
MSNFTPPVRFDAFERLDEAAALPVLRYPKLQQHSQQARQLEPALWREFMATDEGSLDEEDRARALARGYLVLTSLQLQQAGVYRQVVSERFTQAAIELFGAPDASEARQLAIDQIQELSELFSNDAVDTNRLFRVLIFLNYQVGYYSPDEVRTKENGSSESIKKLGHALKERFGPALEVFNEIDPEQASVPVEDVLNLFKKAKDLLAEREPDWNNYGIAVSNLGPTSYKPDKKAVYLNSDRKYPPKNLKALFIEEVLVHNLRALNGAKTGDYMMENGLPEFMPAEEAVGLFQKVADYYKKLAELKAYVHQQISGGADPAGLLDYLLMAKFDPTNQRHTAYVAKFMPPPVG